MERVRAIVDGVFGMAAPPADLLAAARYGIDQIDQIAETAPEVAEEQELLDLCEPLEQLAEELQALLGETGAKQ
jgi:hypothetical protein